VATGLASTMSHSSLPSERSKEVDGSETSSERPEEVGGAGLRSERPKEVRGSENRSEFKIVQLYQAAKWGNYMCQNTSSSRGHTAPTGAKFNWFLCSTKYKDDKSGFDVAELMSGIRFYEQDNGTNYILKEKTTILILPSSLKAEEGCHRPEILTPTTINKQLLSVLDRYGYSGVATFIKNNGEYAKSFGTSLDTLLCTEVVFMFRSDILKIDTNKINCPIIQYARQNNKCIRAKIPTFPSSSDIDTSLSALSTEDVCKILYKDIAMYTSKK